jgi:F-box-like
MKAAKQGPAQRTNKYKQGRKMESNEKPGQTTQAGSQVAPQRARQQTPQQQPRQQRRASPADRLPPSVVVRILSFLPCGKGNLRNLRACCLVSHAWYKAAIPCIYERPPLRSENFRRFVMTIRDAPPIGGRRALVEFARYVKHLDLSAINVENYSTCRNMLVWTVQGSLQTFVEAHSDYLER